MTRPPEYHEEQVSPTRYFLMNRYNHSHLFVQTNTANNAIFKIGDYQTINVPPRQWVYWPYPESERVQQLLPTFPIYLAIFATDEVISQLGRVGEGYQDYARVEQAFSAFVSAAPTVGNYVAIQISNPSLSQVNVIIDKIFIDSLSLPSVVLINQGVTPDPNVTNTPTISNHRLDGPSHSIVPTALVTSSTSLASPVNTTDIQISPGSSPVDCLHGSIREIPKLYVGTLTVYARSTSATNPITIDLSWYEEKA